MTGQRTEKGIGKREEIRDRDKEKSKDRSKEREKEKYRSNDREREKERERHKDKEKEKANDKDRDRDALVREKGKERIREKDRKADQDKEKARQRDKVFQNAEVESGGSLESAFEPGQRISKMKEKRLMKKSEGVSEVLAWVSKSRKLDVNKNVEKEKALQLSKTFDEQDNINQGETEDEVAAQHTAQELGGVKLLHGLDKVVKGGAVVLTLKDQSILAGGDINKDVGMLENVEIGEQKRRNEAYRAAKRKVGIYGDKFNDEPGSEKKLLPQYDDPVVDEGVTLDSSGRFTGEAEKKLEELQRRIQGVSTNNNFEDLNSTGKISSDYYTHEEMVQFKKPKKKKSSREKEKLDINVLEAEVVSAGLGFGDLGSRNDGKSLALKEEQERSEAQIRSDAYISAYIKADEASKSLRLEQTLTIQAGGDDTPVFGGDDEDLHKSLERARKFALERQNEVTTSGPRAIALLASSTASNPTADNENPTYGETQENKVVFTEMEEFVLGLQLDEELHKYDGEDVFMDEDVAPNASDQETEDGDGGWIEVKDAEKDETPVNEEKEEIVPDDITYEVSIGKGLSGAIKLLKDRGTLKETVEWGGNGYFERTDVYGRVLTQQEAFRLFSYKFHGKGPGKMKEEKRMRKYKQELKVKQKNANTPLLSMERMIESQARLKAPYLVLSGHVKPGQTSDPRSGFTTVEKDFPPPKKPKS